MRIHPDLCLCFEVTHMIIVRTSVISNCNNNFTPIITYRTWYDIMQSLIESIGGNVVHLFCKDDALSLRE